MEVPNPIGWTDEGNYWLNTDYRYLKGKTPRLSASNFGTAAGHCLQFSTPEEYAEFFLGYRKKEFTELEQKRLDHGNTYEADAIRWYENRFSLHVQSCNIIIPKWDPRLSGKVDGLIGDEGILEIKCTYDKMYTLLDERIKNPENFTGFYHIYSSHYDQMQGYIKMFNRKWCDYVVYSLKDNKVYYERIYFNEEYWENELYPRIKKFLEIIVPMTKEKWEKK